MTLTDYHTKYFAYEITKRHSADELEKLTGALVDAQVDLNPHQVDAALFAFRSPLSKGAILADEVGLGKTIEAGLIISQRWAERKRRILIVTPANLRKQWLQELQEKFFVPCRILETKSYNQSIKEGNANPFDCDEIIICSYHFARNKAHEVGKIPWNLVVIDEAHRLRNVYKRSNKIANELRDTLAGSHKLLLTATPLQNSLLELYGLVSFVDGHLFGDLKSFREQYADVSNPRIFQRLKERISPVCQRTLRSQVLPYIRYTERHPILEKFTPTEDEETLYEMVSDYLRKPQLLALPTGQRQLITLVLRKLLASSTYAIAGALQKMANRLQKQLDETLGITQSNTSKSISDEMDEDFEHFDEIEDEWEADREEPVTTAEQQALIEEISELRAFYELAVSIEHNAKGTALLNALDTAFAQATHLGAERKALIFTESRRTQEYLVNLLQKTTYGDGIVLFNGSNDDEKSKSIYTAWQTQHQNTDRFTGSRTADMRSALVDYFRNQGTVMIATEAGAEGINLQFCSLVVNYDLPWNPQRIEQRIGRCHRYGQQHDVVVVNFLNQKNAADQRVFELLAEKFQLFNGVFGASDEVLGTVESGVAFEKRIAEIYQTCRTPAEINTEFDRLQQELSTQIEEAMTRAHQNLLENFDDVVKDKLRIRDQESKAYLNRYERMLMDLTRHELNGHADFLSDSAFVLKENPFATGDFANGRYELPRRSGEAHLYRLAHPLAQQILERAKARSLPTAELHFDYRNAPNKITILEELPTKSGWVQLSLLTVAALDQTEDRLIWSGISDDDTQLDDELLSRLFTLPAQVYSLREPLETEFLTKTQFLDEQTENQKLQQLQEISERNATFFEEEIAKLEAWADDRKVALEREIKEFDRRINEARRTALAAPTLNEKLVAQKEVKALEKERSSRRRALFVAQDEVDEQRDRIIAETENQLTQTDTLTTLFTIRWSVS